MPATRPTTLQQRQGMMKLAQAGLTYREIAQQLNVSFWTARKWGRRTRAGDERQLVSVLGAPRRGPLADCHPLVRYLALRWKRQHPQWGVGYIVQKLKGHPGLRDHPRPAAVSVWRYWRMFGDRLFPKRQGATPPPPKTGVVHGVWQLDFNESVDGPGLGRVTFTQARDSVGRATVLHRVHPAPQADQRIVKLTTEQVQADCRIAFAQWGLPDAIQTDRASLFVDDDATPFPSRLSLWWIGLGLRHHLIPRHTPECNGSVERSHRTTNERTLSGQRFGQAAQLQSQLDADWAELNTQCPSRAAGCDGKPPVRAYPDLLRPRRLYFAEDELRLFDLQRVYAYLTHFTWVRLVNSHGQLSLGSQRYGLGHAWAGQKVAIRFDPPQRVFLFTALHPRHPRREPITRPAQGLSVTDLCGPIEVRPTPPQQLSFPWAVFFPAASPARLSETPPEARV